MRRTRIATPDRRGPRLARTMRSADRLPPPFVPCALSLLAALERAPLPSYNPPMTYARAVAYSSLAALLALYVVGAVSVPPGSLRHEVQTLPLWFPIVAGLRGKPIAKWAALPCFIFWLPVMIFIWLFLLGWARIVSGLFFPSGLAMTLVIG